MTISTFTISTWLFGLLVNVVVVGMSPRIVSAGETDSFIDTFIQNYERQNFTEQVTLVKKNKNRIADAINALTLTAFDEKRGFDQRMYLLNIASSMAYMHRHWNGDPEPIAKLDPIIEQELKQDRQRRMVLLEGKKQERLLGNFVMGRHEQALQDKGLAKVLYPHWLHRTMFECKVCHSTIFKMKRWSNNISQEDIVAGKQCGVCHNGKLAFSASDNCKRCHLVGNPEAERLHDPGLVSQSELKKMVSRVGAEWRPERLKGGKLPLDRFGFINWLELKRKGVFTPIVSLDPDYREKTYDTKILFKSKSDFVDDVLFDHQIHSDWLSCSSCHPALFREQLGGNNIKMLDMRHGRYCGHCHGKVSFTFADCTRCHKQSNNKPPANALIRQGH